MEKTVTSSIGGGPSVAAKSSRIPVHKLDPTTSSTKTITVPPIRSPTLSPSRIPVPTRIISPRHQIVTSTTTTTNTVVPTAAVQRSVTPPPAGSPSTSSMASSSQLSSSIVTSPNETPKHAPLCGGKDDEVTQLLTTARNLQLETDTIIPHYSFDANTNSSKVTSTIPSSQPLQHTSLHHREHSLLSHDYITKPGGYHHQFTSPSVLYNISNDGQFKDTTVHQRTTSNESSDDPSTLTLSSLSIPSKLSLLSPAKPNIATALLGFSGSQNTQVTSTISSSGEGHTLDNILTSTQMSSSLLATKTQMQLELEKETLKKELDETKSTMEFLENENKMIQEKCSKFEVDNSALQIKNTQLQEHLERCKKKQKDEQVLAVKMIEKEKATLLDQLVQVKQERESLTEKLLSVQKEHSLCSQQIEIATTVNSDTDKQLNTFRVALKESEEKIRLLQDTVRSSKMEKDNLRRNFELEKNQFIELQSSFVTIKQSLETSNKKLDESRQKCLLKDELLSRKESQVSLLQGELNIMKDNYRAVASSHDSLTMELQVLKQDWENKKNQLVEVVQKKETGDSSIRELNEKLSNFERELKEKEATLDNELKERKQLEGEVSMLKQKSQTLEQQLALQATASSKREREIASAVVEKDALKSLVAGRDSELRNIQISSGHQISELKNLVAAMETKNKTQSEVIEEKEEVIKSLSLQKKTLECSLEFEREQKTSLNQTIVCLNEELETFKQQCQALENEKETMSRTATTKAKALTETEALTRKQMEGLEKETKTKEAKLHTVTVQLTQKEAELERALGKISDLQTQVALLNADVDNNKRLVESLKLKLQRLQETKNQEISDVKQKFEDKRSEVVKLTSQLDSFQFELREKEDTLTKEKETVDQEKKTIEELRGQLLASEVSCSSLRSHLTQSEERVKTLELALSEKKTQLQVMEEKKHAIASQLQNTQRTLQETQKANSDERAHFTETLGNVSIQHKQEMTKMVQDLESLQLHVKETKESLHKVQQQYKQTKSELTCNEINLKSKEEECHKLCSSIEKEIASRTETITQLTKLQSQYDTLCNEKQTMEEQMSSQSSEINQLQVKLNSLQQHHTRLQQEMQLQSEVHSTSTKRMEEKEKESSGQYERKVKELKIKLQKSEEMVQEMGGELSRVQLENGSLQTQLSHLTQTSDNLKSQLNEKKATLSSEKQKTNQLERALEQEKLIKTQMQESLTREMTRHQELKTKVEHLKEKLSQTASSKGSVEALLEDEKRNTLLLQEKIREFENILDVLRVTFKNEKESFLAEKQKMENDQSTIKKKYQSEKKILKDTLKGLQSEVEILRSTVDSHSKEITKLDKALNVSEQEKDKLSDKRAEHERLLREKKELLKLAEVKIQNQETQITQLQVQISTLHQSQLDLEEYKKTIETKQRDELQRILSEVTEHMEEQYSAHHYLEKLRADNESLAMKEKDRKIGHLKNELKAQKKELKKEKLQVESLTLEAKYLKAKQKEHERSREKVGSRLEKVSTLLNSGGVPTANNNSMSGNAQSTSILSSSIPHHPSAGSIPPIPISTSTPLLRKSLQ